ncbi:D-2-hydroxyacid dehydrogenase [Salinispira pacifica]
MQPVVLLGFEERELPDGVVDRIEDLLPGREVVVTRDRGRMEPLVDRIEIACGSVPFDLFPRAPGLKWYHHWYAGVDWLERHPEIRASEIEITNTSGVHAIPVSEQILAFMFAFARNLHLNVRAQQSRVWRRESMAAIRELAGRSVLVVGAGAIGAHFARAAGCLGMKVSGIRRHPAKGGEGLESVHGIDQLDSQLGLADFVVVILPATPETRGLFSAAQFQAMKSDAVFINVGRGSIVDEPALVEALRSSTIAGACLDVFESEPLPEESPLWEMDNVIIAPHTAGYTPEYAARSFDILLSNIPRYLSGRELLNRVDKQAGY